MSTGQRVSSLRILLGAAGRPEDKRLVLAGLGEMPDMEALRAIEPFMADEKLKDDAVLAATKISVGLPGGQAREAMTILQKALSTADDAGRQKLEAALKQMQDSADYITDWLAAGPFRQEGKDYAALFDVVFPPETDNPKGVDWKPIPAGVDPKRPYVMDLLKMLGGGQQCVAYARTWVHVDKDLAALLQLGSDDGIKVWLNDKQVYALNTARPLQPGSDKVTVNLHSGWNMLLLKVTQNNLGWEFCARLVNPNGSHVEGLQVEAAPKTSAAAHEN